MGLDVAVFRTARRLTEHACGTDDSAIDACHEAGHVQVFAYQGFAPSLAGCEPLAEDDLYGKPVLSAGWWKAEDRAMTVSNSYSGHKLFREHLALAALGVDVRAIWRDPEPYGALPFYELLNFADNEGCIGPVAAARLAQDFEQHREGVLVGMGEWVSKYDQWAVACAAAADSGLLYFR